VKVSNYKKIIDKADVVSFDIFDTLIKRDVSNPHIVFDIVNAEFFNQTFELNSAFRIDRVVAESKARKKSKKEEINLDDIYSYMISFSEEEKVKLKEIEKQSEINVCVPNTPVVELYKYAKAKGKTIIISTDMYLCRNTITGILKKANILDFDKIYISSEIDKTKRRGTMYREIKKDNPDARIVHVGDNKKSDYFKAKENKLNAILIETETSYLRYSKLSESPILSSFINNRIKNDNNWYYQFGFETFGPILAGFTKWLSNELKIKNYDKIFFLSRDGSIMMKAFEIMCIDVEIPYTYLYGSRRGYIVPSLQSYSSITEMLQNVFTGKIFTINDLLPKLGLSRDILTEEQKRVTERIFNGLDEMYADNEALKLLKKLENQVIENSKVEFERIGKYLKQNDFSGNIAIIDIGWFGNIQHALSRIIGDKAQITGYYIGIHPKSKQVESEKLNGFLFEKGKNEEFQRIIQSFSNIFELLFTSDEGTLINFYEKKDGIVAPNLADFEYSDTNELELIRNIQKGALDFVKAFSDFEYSEFVDVSEVKVFSAIKNFAIKPKMEDVLRFGDLSFADGEVSNYIAKPKSFLNYIVKPKSFIYDMKKSWQAGFFLRLFKIPFPYYSLTEKIKRVRRDKKIGVRSE